jgi:hypothetical protein
MNMKVKEEGKHPSGRPVSRWKQFISKDVTLIEQGK